MRVPAIESPITTAPGFICRSSGIRSAWNGRERCPGKAGRYGTRDVASAEPPCTNRSETGTVSVSRTIAIN